METATRVFVLVLLLCLREGRAATFTFVNRCTGTVWPGIQSNAGSARLDPTGFVLPPRPARRARCRRRRAGPARLWARTACAQDASGKFVCGTGDCGLKSSGGAGTTTAPPTMPGATPDTPRPATGGQGVGGGGADGQGVMLGDNSWLASLATGDPSAAPSSRLALAAGAGALPLLLHLLLLLL
ncbi:hypothetical protein PR202_gb19212 [Eleusine coracana subsp. coracana]|uniref:Thaumatin-like protein n=1 Tax=Eleusine coracana subsp. coracana TaxID=191504 RepID=A0AAV5F9E3_ELECO|nr:hypothetical protein PR202_gb19212 [Eleusine coracana subsp. coracana]